MLNKHIKDGLVFIFLCESLLDTCRKEFCYVKTEVKDNNCLYFDDGEVNIHPNTKRAFNRRIDEIKSEINGLRVVFKNAMPKKQTDNAVEGMFFWFQTELRKLSKIQLQFLAVTMIEQYFIYNKGKNIRHEAFKFFQDYKNFKYLRSVITKELLLDAIFYRRTARKIITGSSLPLSDEYIEAA
jgi:hypothetical protein